MICRLCLRSLSPGTAVFLFETNETLAETRLVKIIAKFLQMEVSGGHKNPLVSSIKLILRLFRYFRTMESRPACAQSAASTSRTFTASGSWWSKNRAPS